MIIVIDQNSGVPVFRQLMDQIRFQIVSGMLASGSELPSTRELSQQLGVNPMTVSKAYHLLEAEHIVERRPGLRLVVRARRPEALERERVQRLRALLEPAAIGARQLGISTQQAVRVFRQLLEETARINETESSA